MFSGRLTPEKGAEELLKAFTEVAQKSSQYQAGYCRSFLL
nr:hypothetical protein [Bifidobacterium breve]